MGSSGSGRFSDYPGTKPKKVVGDGTGIEGGASGVDRCKQAFHTVLEDVGNSDFYSRFRNVPAVGDQLGIVFDKKRVFAVDVQGKGRGTSYFIQLSRSVPRRWCNLRGLGEFLRSIARSYRKC